MANTFNKHGYTIDYDNVWGNYKVNPEYYLTQRNYNFAKTILFTDRSDKRFIVQDEHLTAVWKVKMHPSPETATAKIEELDYDKLPEPVKDFIETMKNIPDISDGSFSTTGINVPKLAKGNKGFSLN